MIQLSDHTTTYQVIKPPREVEECRGWIYGRGRLGRSEKGVYFASFDLEWHLCIWILHEDASCGHMEMEWILRHRSAYGLALPSSIRLSWTLLHNASDLKMATPTHENGILMTMMVKVLSTPKRKIGYKSGLLIVKYLRSILTDRLSSCSWRHGPEEWRTITIWRALRVPSTVWQILFPKSRCLPTPKIIWGGKKDLIFNSLANFISKNSKTC
jgi:hypothetical protein